MALYAMPPQPVMAKLHVGQQFQDQLVGSTTSSASGAYAIKVTSANAVTSSEYFGHVNLMIQAAGNGYFSLYGLPREVSEVSGHMMLGSIEGKPAAVPAQATLILHRLTGKDAAVSDVAASDGCWALETDEGPAWGHIDSVFGIMDGVRKWVTYYSGSTSTVGIALSIDGAPWVNGEAGTTSVTGGAGSDQFPTASGWTDYTYETEFEEGVFESCELSGDAATFPYAWDGGGQGINVGVPAAHYCVYYSAGNEPSQTSTQAFTFSDGIDLTPTIDGYNFGLDLSNVTGWSTDVTLTYQYTTDGWMCGVNNYPERGDDTPKNIVAAPTSAGSS